MATINFLLPIKSDTDPKQYAPDGITSVFETTYTMMISADKVYTLALTHGDGIDSAYGCANDGAGGTSADYTAREQCRFTFFSFDLTDEHQSITNPHTSEHNLIEGTFLIDASNLNQNTIEGGDLLTNISAHAESVCYETLSDGTKMWFKKYTADLA